MAFFSLIIYNKHMARKKQLKQRVDRVYKWGFEHFLIPKLINDFMKHGKKHTAENIVLKAIEGAKTELSVSGAQLFNKVVENLILTKEVEIRRLGGTNYFVPKSIPVGRAERQTMKTIRNVTRKLRKKDPTSVVLKSVLIDTYNEKGAAVKVKEERLEVINANKVFEHFARRPGKSFNTPVNNPKQEQVQENQEVHIEKLTGNIVLDTVAQEENINKLEKV